MVSLKWPGSEESKQPRLGLGMLRLSTEGRPDESDALALIHFALRKGIRILDTADCYGLDSSDLHYGEWLVREALRSWKGPIEEVLVATKVGITRKGTKWIPNGRPEHVRKSVEKSRKTLGLEQIELLLWHARDPQVPFSETLGVLAELQQQGLVRHLGLSNVTLDDLTLACQSIQICCIQNELSLLNPQSMRDGTLARAKELGIPFLAHRPLGGHARVEKLRESPLLIELGKKYSATPEEISLALLLGLDPPVIPLIGATRSASIASSCRALELELDPVDRSALVCQFGIGARVSSPIPKVAQPRKPTSEHEIVIVMGIQGAGKSEYVREFVAQGYARFNRDELGGTMEGLHKQLKQTLATGQKRVVLDNTYPSRSSRAPVISIGKTARIPVRCLHIEIPIPEACMNIAQRMLNRYGMLLGSAEMQLFRKTDPNLPPPQALSNWLRSFEPPIEEEGFDSIERIDFQRQIDPSFTGKGIFLDVDGTLRRTRSGEIYPRHPDDVLLLPRRTEVLKPWVDQGYQLFFISNQGGIAAGRVGHQEVYQSLLRTAELLSLPVRDIVYCPHPTKASRDGCGAGPNPSGLLSLACYCRKPMPGLGVYLIGAHRLNRESLFMVGDMSSDEEFARNLGIGYHSAKDFFGDQGERGA